MKIIHNINFWATLITLILYITVYFGMLSQLVLGPLQLILATIVSVRYYKELDIHHKNLLLYYWVAVAFALTMAITLWTSDIFGSFVVITFLFVVPMSVACYFLYVTKKLNNHLKNHLYENPETTNPGL